jgi:hypothetical protein
MSESFFFYFSFFWTITFFFPSILFFDHDLLRRLIILLCLYPLRVFFCEVHSTMHILITYAYSPLWIHAHSPPINTRTQILSLWASSKTGPVNSRDWQSHHSHRLPLKTQHPMKNSLPQGAEPNTWHYCDLWMQLDRSRIIIKTPSTHTPFKSITFYRFLEPIMAIVSSPFFR